MKRLLFLIALVGMFAAPKANAFNFVIATTDTAFALYARYIPVVDTDQAHITQLGTRPTPPTVAATSVAWTNYVTAANTYDSTLVAFNDTLFAHTKNLRALELATLRTLGYSDNQNIPTPSNAVLNQWVEVQGDFTPGPAWIGMDAGSTHLVIVYSVPSQTFTDYYISHIKP